MDESTIKLILIGLIMVLSWIPILSVGKAKEMIIKARHHCHKHEREE
jgi:hypothetical protein